MQAPDIFNFLKPRAFALPRPRSPPAAAFRRGSSRTEQNRAGAGTPERSMPERGGSPARPQLVRGCRNGRGGPDGRSGAGDRRQPEARSRHTRLAPPEAPSWTETRGIWPPAALSIRLRGPAVPDPRQGRERSGVSSDRCGNVRIGGVKDTTFRFEGTDDMRNGSRFSALGAGW
ncbi:uncharacterized protein ACIB01_009115 [Guaruba guarouba]